MIAYVMLGSNDIPTARAFYDPLMHLIGAEPRPGASEKRVSYAEAGAMPILAITRPYDEAPAQAGNGVMVAFPVASRERVEEAHALALRLGAHDEGAPGVRSDQTNSFYSCYFRDPVGNKLCICHFDRPVAKPAEQGA